MTYRQNMTKEEREEARENALYDLELQIWRDEQKQPLILIQKLLEWMDENSSTDYFSQLNTWSNEKVNDLIDKLEDFGIWVSRIVNPFAESQQWNDVLSPLVKEGRTAKIISAIQVAKSDERWKNVINLFTRARAELEQQDLERSLEPDYDFDHGYDYRYDHGYDHGYE